MLRRDDFKMIDDYIVKEITKKRASEYLTEKYSKLISNIQRKNLETYYSSVMCDGLIPDSNLEEIFKENTDKELKKYFSNE